MSENPYEAPRHDGSCLSLTYYQPVSTRLNLREYRRISKSWFELVLGICLKFSVSERELARLQSLAAATPESPRLPARQPLQGIELICWIVLALGLFIFAGGQPANAAQAAFRLSMPLAAGAGIAIIWLIRGVTWLQRKTDE